MRQKSVIHESDRAAELLRPLGAIKKKMTDRCKTRTAGSKDHSLGPSYKGKGKKVTYECRLRSAKVQAVLL